jgi:hypothetical protein
MRKNGKHFWLGSWVAKGINIADNKIDMNE